jgi:hypothetical protein
MDSEPHPWRNLKSANHVSNYPTAAPRKPAPRAQPVHTMQQKVAAFAGGRAAAARQDAGWKEF